MKDMNLLLGVALFGAAGAVARFLISGWVNQSARGDFPWGTLVVNVIGCLLLGAVMEWELHTGGTPTAWRLIVAGGFLGAFTTFSTFGFETIRHLEQGEWNHAAWNVGLNVVIGLLAVLAGTQLIRQFFFAQVS